MLRRDCVVDATNPILGQRPESLNGLGMDIPTHIDLFLVSDPLVLIPFGTQLVVEPSLIGENGRFGQDMRNEHIDVGVARWRNSGACTLTTAASGAVTFESCRDGPLQLVRRQRFDVPVPWIDRQPLVRECLPAAPAR